jgi:hypothetical protein
MVMTRGKNENRGKRTKTKREREFTIQEAHSTSRPRSVSEFDATGEDPAKPLHFLH